MRIGAVPALAGKRDLHLVDGGHHAALAEAELADRSAWLVVEREDGVAREGLEDALLHHDARAADVLLGRLEDEVHGAGEVLRLGEVAGGAEQHRRVAVVAAGMHLAGGFGE